MASSIISEIDDSFSYSDSRSAIFHGSSYDDTSITNYIDEFISKALSLPPSPALISRHFTQLDESILTKIVSFLDQRSVLSVIRTCHILVEPARKRLYRRLCIVNDVNEQRSVSKESVKPITLILKSQLLRCFDVIRMGDPRIRGYVRELTCFATWDWVKGDGFTINDSWYLTIPLLSNVEVLVWPQLPILKFQAIKVDMRCNLRTLCVGVTNLLKVDLQNYDNSVLQFPNIRNLIINLDNVNDVEDVELLCDLLVYGDVLRKLDTLTISGGGLNKIISPCTNVTSPTTHPVPLPIPRIPSSYETQQTPIKQTVIVSNRSRENHQVTKRQSLKNKLRQNFKLSPLSSPNAEVCYKESLQTPFDEPCSPVISLINSASPPSPEEDTFSKNSPYSALWRTVLSLFGKFQRLRLTTFTLDHVIISDSDTEELLGSISWSHVKNLELSNVLIQYDEHDEMNNSILNSLLMKLQKIEKLSLDVRFKCDTCGQDCNQYGNSEIQIFLDKIPPLKLLNLITYGTHNVKPEFLYRHRNSMELLSLSTPDKLSNFIQLLNANLRLVSEFCGDDKHGRGKVSINKAFKMHLTNNVENTVLLNDVVMPHINQLMHYNVTKNLIFNNYKYQLLSFFGDQFDEFDQTFPNLQEISFFGMKFKFV